MAVDHLIDVKPGEMICRPRATSTNAPGPSDIEVRSGAVVANFPAAIDSAYLTPADARAWSEALLWSAKAAEALAEMKAADAGGRLSGLSAFHRFRSSRSRTAAETPSAPVIHKPAEKRQFRASGIAQYIMQLR